MSEATLFTIERPGAGLITTTLSRVKDTVAVRVVREDGTVEEYPLNGISPATTSAPPASAVDRVVLEFDDGHEIDLAKSEGAVAVVVTHAQYNQVYWIEGGRCVGDQSCVSFSDARSEIERRYPRAQELPPLRAGPQ